MAASDLEKRVARLERLVRGREGQRVGDSWRITEGPYPTPTSATCLLLQMHKGGVWATVLILQPDGTIAPA